MIKSKKKKKIQIKATYFAHERRERERDIERVRECERDGWCSFVVLKAAVALKLLMRTAGALLHFTAHYSLQDCALVLPSAPALLRPDSPHGQRCREALPMAHTILYISIQWKLEAYWTSFFAHKSFRFLDQ